MKISEITENELIAEQTMDLLGNGDFSRGQVGLIVAETGVGKSVYSFDLAARLVLGGFLYNKEEIPIRSNLKVQVFTSEYNRNDVMRAMKGLTLAFPNVDEWQERLDGEYLDIPVDVEDRLGFVLAKIEEQRKEFGADIFILDNFFSMFGSKSTTSVNAEGVMVRLIQFAECLGIGIIVVHHSGKSGSKCVSAGYGSCILGAKARFEIVLSRCDFTADDQYLTVSFKKRFTNVSNIQLRKNLQSEYPYFSESESMGGVYGKWYRENLAVEGWHSKEGWIAILGRIPTIGTKNRFTAFNALRDYRRNPFLVQSLKTQEYAPIPFLKKRIGEITKIFEECLNSKDSAEGVQEVIEKYTRREWEEINEIGGAFRKHLGLIVKLTSVQEDGRLNISYEIVKVDSRTDVVNEEQAA